MSKSLPQIHKRWFEEKAFKLEHLELEFSNGEQRTYQRMLPGGAGRGAVIVVPLLDPHTVLLSREYCGGVHRYELGVVRGRIDPNESEHEAANREMMEEIGYGAGRLDTVRKLALAPSYMAHETWIILARDLYLKRLEGDEPEPIDVLPYPLANLDQLVLSNEISEGRALAAIFAARAFAQLHP
jgi:ADP-ribose diphosphatase